MVATYPNVGLLIDGVETPGSGGRTIPIMNPATGEEVGRAAHAEIADLDRAIDAADRAFKLWRRVPALERYRIMRVAADLVRERAEDIATSITAEVGKPIGQARSEVLVAADHIDWCAEEGRRAYGRVIPARGSEITQLVVRQPVGPVAAFTPWNFPVNQIVRKIGGALGAGCSIIVKGPEEAPSSCLKTVRAFVDAGIPDGLINLVFGTPAEISEYLIPHPIIQKIAFTGSTAVGRHLASLAGQYMKRSSMELGGHCPAVVFDDADVEDAVQQLVAYKFRNAGQLCVAPTRFLVQEQAYERFVDAFVTQTQGLKVGPGIDESTQMGPLCHPRRVEFMEALVADATDKGAELRTGGGRMPGKGLFVEPTVLTDVPLSARLMNEEPFGPVAAFARPFKDLDEAIEECNRIRYGLAAFVYTRSQRVANVMTEQVEAGTVCVNHIALALPEVPHGGVKDSGYGLEGGSETLEPYLVTKYVSQKNI